MAQRQHRSETPQPRKASDEVQQPIEASELAARKRQTAARRRRAVSNGRRSKLA